MKIKYCVVFLFFFCIQLPSVFAGVTEDWMSEVRSSATDELFTKQELRNHLNSAQYIIKQNPNNPYFWYIVANFYSELHGYYYDETYPLGKYDPNSPESQELVKKYSEYYLKALEADDDPNSPVHFDVDTLVNISQVPLLEADVKTKALQKEMQLSQSGGYVSENPNYIWETYEVMLENYIQQQDYDSYLKTVNEMIERFPGSSQMDSLLEAKRQALVAIEQRDRDAAMQDGYAQTDTYATPKAVAVQKPVKAVEPKKVEEPKATNEEPASDNTGKGVRAL